jgi:glucose/arabinose dehydrogenase
MRHQLLAGTFALIGATGLAPGTASAQQPPPDPFATVYKESCSACHGENMEGATQGPALAGALRRGDSVDQITKNIAAGFPDAGMPAFGGTLDAVKIQRLAIFIGEKRANLAYTDFKVAAPPVIPAGAITTREHSFRIETVATGIDRLPYAIAPLPDGRILVTEKTRGLRIVAKDGTVSELVKGTPKAFDDGFEVPGIKLVYGMGYVMDVAPHPDYAKNGWIYLHFTERCSDCNEAARKSKRPVSGNVVVRARIRNGEWVDQQPIWRTPIEQYTAVPDMAAGGRLAFDGNGHVFLSVGIKSAEYNGIQDLSLPYGKIHRVNDDGTIPADNPFVGVANAMPSIWTYGHRSPEGLEFDRRTGRLWETEMGQRGGDEVNLLQRGQNYGWPLRSKGLKYDGTPVDYGTLLGIVPDLAKMQEPVVDFTPSPAVSSFIVYDGTAFPRWRGNLLVGSLKATELYRVVPDGKGAAQVETLLKGVGRIRDVAHGPDGVVYVLIEHASGGRIVKLVPAK